jgi:hypothetical protein
MNYTIFDHEIQRLSVLVKAIGWEIKGQRKEEKGVTLVIHREFSDALLKASGDMELKKKSR